jgi:hypothetical protein
LRESVVDGLVPSVVVLVEDRESTHPLSLVVIESAPELELGLLDLIQDHLELGIDGTKRSLEAGVVVVWLIRGQIDESLIPDVRST